MDGPGAGLLAVALWVAALLAIALVIRSSLRREDRPWRRSQTTSPKEDDPGVDEDASYAESEESRTLGDPAPVKRDFKAQNGRRERVSPRPMDTRYRGRHVRPSGKGGSIDAQIAALADGPDDDLQRLIHSVRESRPASSRRREPIQRQRWAPEERTTTNGSSEAAGSEAEGFRSTGGITYVVVDEEGRPEPS
jgi:hypothetical protein